MCSVSIGPSQSSDSAHQLHNRNSQCDPSRPDVHLEPWKRVQAVGDLGGLERRWPLTRPTRVVLRERVERLGVKGQRSTQRGVQSCVWAWVFNKAFFIHEHVLKHLSFTWFSINHVLVSNLIIRLFWGAFITSSASYVWINILLRHITEYIEWCLDHFMSPQLQTSHWFTLKAS